MLLAGVLFFAGLLLLYFGAEALVSGASRLALSFGIRPLVIGMTVVAFATSMPELMVSLFAAIRGSSDIAAGNIIGSNIANIGLILGAAAICTPLAVPPRTLVREIPYMIGASLLVYGFSFDGQLGFVNGLVLFVLLWVFLGYCLRGARRLDVDEAITTETPLEAGAGRKKDVVLVLLGIAGLGVGAEMMVRSAVTIALSLGVSEVVVGVTVVALGTSLPELAASLMSAWKGEADIGIGNVIGSNIFNLLFVLGLCPMIHPIAIDPALLRFEFPVMLIFSVALIPLMKHRLALGRGKGMVLLGVYLFFVGAVYFRGV